MHLPGTQGLCLNEERAADAAAGLCNTCLLSTMTYATQLPEPGVPRRNEYSPILVIPSGSGLSIYTHNRVIILTVIARGMKLSSTL